MSNKTVLYPDHFVGPCINHLGTRKDPPSHPTIYKRDTHTTRERDMEKSLYQIETKQPNYQELCISILHDLTKTTQSQICLKIVSYSQFVE